MNHVQITFNRNELKSIIFIITEYLTLLEESKTPYPVFWDTILSELYSIDDACDEHSCVPQKENV